MDSEFTARLGLAFKASKLTQQELGERLGVCQSTVSHWLTGRRHPGLGRIELIAAELGVDVAELAFGARGRPAPVRARRTEKVAEIRAAS